MHWCLGFALKLDPDAVLLLKKSRTLHVNFWNGLGGKVEEGESALDAMRREFKEEAGFEIDEWKYVGALYGKDNLWKVSVYGAKLPTTREYHQIDHTYLDKTEFDTPYLVEAGDLRSFQLAPHTRPLAYMAIDAVRYPNVRSFDLQEV